MHNIFKYNARLDLKQELFYTDYNMTATIVEFFNNITGNDYLTLFIISIIPIIELRGAIVLMVGMDVQPIVGMLCCIAGSSVMIIPLILVIRPLIRKLKASKTFSKFGKKLEENLSERAPDVDSEQQGIKKKLSKDAKKAWGTFAFVAVPLPMTGSWTGSAIAGILDFPLWKAALSVFAGNIVAAGILTLIFMFVPEGYADFVLYGFIILAVALFVVFYFTRVAKRERKFEAEKDRYGNRSLYELARLEKDASESGEELIKKEYIDSEGNQHIVVGSKGDLNSKAVDNDHLI